MMMRYVSPLFLIASVSLLSVACGDAVVTGGGGSGGQATGGAAHGGADAGGAGGGGPSTPTYTVTFDPLTVQPGTDTTQCIVKRLGNDVDIRVNQIHNVLPNGSHHLIVYRTADTEEKLTPYDCQPFADTLDPTKGSPLMITQKHDELLTLPDGVGFSLKAGMMVRLEMHYINAGQEPIDVSATSTFITMRDEDFQNEADFLFVGSPDIDIAAHATATVGPDYLPLPADFADSKFFGITGHTHQWGKDVKVWVADTKDGPDTPIYDVPNWQWSEPETVYHDPAFQVPAGGGFRFTCDYENQSDQSVGFGESAKDEMCFFWAYYYPSHGAFVCAHTDQFGGYDICCPGNPLCSQLL
ncbi:MAG: hypothetical protein U0271_01025 [Polyangiaceae bacterium]